MRIVHDWNRFWFTKVSARPLGVYRILFCAIALFNLLVLTTDFDYWLTNKGMQRGFDSMDIAGPLRFSILNYYSDPLFVRVFFAATAVALTLFMVGWRTRIMSVISYFMMLMIHHHNLCSINGADVYLVVTAFYLMLSPCGAAYSLDARREALRRGGAAFAEPIVPAWSIRLIQVQLSVVYFTTAFLKLGGVTWQNGTALHYVINNEEIRRFDWGLIDLVWLVNIATYLTIVGEFALVFLLWSRSARFWVMLFGVLLHFGIVLTIHIPIFGELCVATYVVFLTTDELDRYMRALNPLNWFARRRTIGSDRSAEYSRGVAEQPVPA